VFRSIDSNSAKGFPKDPRAATMKVTASYHLAMLYSVCFAILLLINTFCFDCQNLVCGKNVLIDMSIHTAYVHAIRAAQHYIYIENQYFIGSSFNWDSNKDLGRDAI